MKKSITGTIKFWRVALRELYSVGLINESDFIRMHRTGFIEGYVSNPHEGNIMDMVTDTIKNKDIFIPLIREEIAFISKGTLPESKLRFKKMWLSYLLDCLENDLIEQSDFDSMKDSIDFDIPRDRTRELCMRLVSQCKYAIFEITLSGGQTAESLRAYDIPENKILQLFMASDKEKSYPKTMSIMDYQRPPLPQGYVTIDELEDIIITFLLQN